jgi:hypothetical protein
MILEAAARRHSRWSEPSGERVNTDIEALSACRVTHVRGVASQQDPPVANEAV